MRLHRFALLLPRFVCLSSDASMFWLSRLLPFLRLTCRRARHGFHRFTIWNMTFKRLQSSWSYMVRTTQVRCPPRLCVIHSIICLQNAGNFLKTLDSVRSNNDVASSASIGSLACIVAMTQVLQSPPALTKDSATSFQKIESLQVSWAALIVWEKLIRHRGWLASGTFKPNWCSLSVTACRIWPMHTYTCTWNSLGSTLWPITIFGTLCGNLSQSRNYINSYKSLQTKRYPTPLHWKELKHVRSVPNSRMLRMHAIVQLDVS